MFYSLTSLTGEKALIKGGLYAPARVQSTIKYGTFTYLSKQEKMQNRQSSGMVEMRSCKEQKYLDNKHVSPTL